MELGREPGDREGSGYRVEEQVEKELPGLRECCPPRSQGEIRIRSSEGRKSWKKAVTPTYSLFPDEEVSGGETRKTKSPWLSMYGEGGPALRACEARPAGTDLEPQEGG